MLHMITPHVVYMPYVCIYHVHVWQGTRGCHARGLECGETCTPHVVDVFDKWKSDATINTPDDNVIHICRRKIINVSFILFFIDSCLRMCIFSNYVHHLDVCVCVCGTCMCHTRVDPRGLHRRESCVPHMYHLHVCICAYTCTICMCVHVYLSNYM